MSIREDRSTTFPLRAAMEARDLAAVVDAFAPGAVLRSPFTGKLVFQGREQIAAVSAVVLDVFDDFRYTDELCSGDTAFLVARARIDGEDIEMVDHLRLGPDGKILEMTVFFRPLPASAVALRMIGAGLVRQKSPLTATVISVLARPLGFMAKSGDGLGVRLVRSAVS
jgi:hypothetical protein